MHLMQRRRERAREARRNQKCVGVEYGCTIVLLRPRGPVHTAVCIGLKLRTSSSWAL